MEGVEAVVVGDGDIGTGLQQNGQHVVSLLADGVMERRVSLRVLQRAQRAKSGTENLLAGFSNSSPVPSLPEGWGGSRSPAAFSPPAGDPC